MSVVDDPVFAVGERAVFRGKQNILQLNLGIVMRCINLFSVMHDDNLGFNHSVFILDIL